LGSLWTVPVTKRSKIAEKKVFRSDSDSIDSSIAFSALNSVFGLFHFNHHHLNVLNISLKFHFALIDAESIDEAPQ